MASQSASIRIISATRPVWFNHKRLHSSIGCILPSEVEQTATAHLASLSTRLFFFDQAASLIPGVVQTGEIRTAGQKIIVYKNMKPRPRFGDEQCRVFGALYQAWFLNKKIRLVPGFFTCCNSARSLALHGVPIMLGYGHRILMAINPWKFTLHPAFNRALVSLFSTSCRAKAEGRRDRTIHPGGRSVKKLVFGKAISAIFFVTIFLSPIANAEPYANGSPNSWLTNFTIRIFMNMGSKSTALTADSESFQDEEITLNTW